MCLPWSTIWDYTLLKAACCLGENLLLSSFLECGRTHRDKTFLPDLVRDQNLFVRAIVPDLPETLPLADNFKLFERQLDPVGEDCSY